MYTIYHDLNINSSKAKVFEAISTETGMNNWWTLKCNGQFKKGELINLNFTDKFDWYAEITDFNSNEFIAFKITKATEDWMPTSFGFLLTEVHSNETTVEFYHKNWKEISKEFRVASFCWASLLSQMKQYIEQGIITPFEKRN